MDVHNKKKKNKIQKEIKKKKKNGIGLCVFEISV
jgi:hypothetical protein